MSYTMKNYSFATLTAANKERAAFTVEGYNTSEVWYDRSRKVFSFSVYRSL